MDAAPEVTAAPAPAAPARTTAGPWDVFWAVAAIVLINALFLGPLLITHVVKTSESLGLRWLPVDAVITLGVAWWFGCRKYGRSWRQGFSFAPVPRRLLGLGTLLGLACASLAFLLPGGTEETPMYHMMNDLLQSRWGGLQMVGLGLLAAAMEETYYRGFIFPALAEAWGRRRAIVVVATWFALLHAPQLGFHWFALSIVATVSVVVTVLRAYTGSVLPGLCTHLTYNLCLTAPALLSSLADLPRHG